MINLLRALPDSNWDTPNWQLGTLPIKLRALLFTKYIRINYLINNYTKKYTSILFYFNKSEVTRTPVNDFGDHYTNQLYYALFNTML